MRNCSPLVLFLFLCWLSNNTGYAQEPHYPNPAAQFSQTPQTNAPQTIARQTIQDVRIEGNLQVATADILRIIKTRPGRPFNATVLEEDKRALMQKTWFVDVRPKVQQTPDGYIVTFQCIERQLIRYIKFVGNKAHTKKTLMEEGNIKVGDALDPIAIQQAAERMAQFYRESGYHQVHIEILGGEFGDRGVTFHISEGPRQRVLSVEFEGNQIATSERLKTQIQTKPGFFFWINSDFTRKKMDDDVETLTNYYRKLGFFYAKVDRVFEETSGYTGLGQPRGWIKVKYIIDEGPRCKIRNIQFVGNKVFDQETLLKKMKLAGKRNVYYNQDMLETDMQTIKELYGDDGYVFARPSPDPRVEQDYVDLVVTIQEGPRCYLSTLDVEIIGLDGTESYTKWHPVLNRVSVRPGDLVRTSEINASRRRLMASQLFNTNPTQGAIPEFQLEYPKTALEMEAAAEREAERIASGEPQIRGQAPHQSVPFAPIIRGVAPTVLAEPTIQVAPHSTTPVRSAPIQSAPQTSPPSNSIYRGQSPTTTAATFAPPVPAQVYSSQPSSTNFGSVAAAPAPLQMPTSSSASREFQMVSLTDTIRGNPYNTIQAPSNIRYDPNAPPGVSPYIHPMPGKWIINETRTGSVMASIAVSSDAGLMGRFVYEEQNFDILNYPKGFRLMDWRNAFRGGGQRFRIEAVPGTQVQRYSANWETPHLFNLDYSFGVSGFYYQRYYDEWYEDRVGGALSFGKLWTPDFSTRLSLGGQQVNIYRPAMPVQDLYDVLGKHPMYTIGLTADHNTRDSDFMPTEGHMISVGVEQVVGDYQFVRGHVDVRKYFMLRERPDRSGRWVLGLCSRLGVSEKNTPIYERYFGGGFSNLRGFDFRGVSPRTVDGYILGGNFEFYNSAEMIFPLTADDMIRGSVFIDTGTVEKSITKWEDKYRVAMGFGLRLTIPMMGPAPIALDFAFPLSMGRGDDKQIFSFSMTMMR